MKSVQIRILFCSVFSPNAGKYGREETPYLDIFHAVPQNNWCKFLLLLRYFTLSLTLMFCFITLMIRTSFMILIFGRCFRSSRPSAFYKIGVLKIYVKFLGILESLFNKVTGLWSEILLKNRLQHGYFSMKLVKIWRNSDLRNTSGWLLLIFRKLDIQTFNSK